MQTHFAPDTAAALSAAVQAFAVANPVAAFAACVILTAAFATWAARQI